MPKRFSAGRYRELLALARRHAGAGIEAGDLVSEACLAAMKAGLDPADASSAWMSGAMRNIARMAARSGSRRRRREAFAFTVDEDRATSRPQPVDFAYLPPSLRIVAMLATSGHHRDDIRHLLRLSDAALRQRIAGLRAQLAGAGTGAPAEPVLASHLDLGLLRQALLPLVRRTGLHMASHDPDGHLVAFSVPGAHKIASGGNKGRTKQEGAGACFRSAASERSATT